MALGSLVVEVSANTVAFSSDMGKIAQIAETSMRRTEQAQKIATAASDRFVAALKFQADTFGKTDVEILRYKADLLGAGNAAAPLIAQIEQLKQSANGLAAGDGIRKTAHEMENVGFKTAGAKRELLVLAHELSQGNFSRFGGSLLVLGERTGAASLLFSALGLTALAAAGAVAAFAVAAYKGAEESDNLAKSLKLTGNFAGLTEDQFRSLSKTIASETSSGVGVARDALSALAGTGKFTSESLKSLSDASVDISRLTGKTAEEVAKDFEKMSDGVAKYASNLNESYHFLSAAQFEHIRTLEEEGRKQEAMAETGKLIDVALKNNDANLGIIKQTLKSAGEAWSRFWDAALDVGRKDTVNDKLKSANADIATLTIRLGAANPNTRTGQLIEDQIKEVQSHIRSLNEQALRENNAAADRAEVAQKQAAGIAASNELKTFHDRYASKADQAAKEIKLYKDAIAARIAAGQGGVDSEAQQQSVIAAIREKFAERGGRKGPKDDPTKEILTGQIAEQEAFITKSKKQSAEYQKDLDFYVSQQYISQADALEIKKTIIEQSLSADEAGYAKEIAALDANLKTVKGLKARAENDNKRAAALARQKATEIEVENQLAQLGKDRGALQRDFALATEEVARKQNLANDAARFQIDLLGKTTLEVQQLTAARQIQLALEDRIRQAVKLGDTDEVAKAIAESRQQQNESGRLITVSYEKQRAGAFGAAEAVRKYGEEAGNTASQIEATMSNAFKGAEDAFVQFTTTGKTSFRSLAQSILADIERILIKKAIAGIIDFAVGAFSPGGGSTGISDTSGSIFSATGASISGRRASGGPVGAGGRYLVGENGPEILSMGGSSGTIIPNGAGGGVSVTVIYNAETGDSKTDSKGDGGNGRRAAELLANKIREVILTEKRAGGLLTT